MGGSCHCDNFQTSGTDTNILNATSCDALSTLAEIHEYLHIPTKIIIKLEERMVHQTVLNAIGVTWSKYPKCDAFNSALEYNEMHNSSHTAAKIVKSRDREAQNMGLSRLTHLLILVSPILIVLRGKCSSKMARHCI
jgi:hypothetical protein